jgi:hypothetical protein
MSDKTSPPKYFYPEWRDERNIRGGTIVLQTNRMHVADERRAQVVSEGAEIVEDRWAVTGYSNQVETVWILQWRPAVPLGKWKGPYGEG